MKGSVPQKHCPCCNRDLPATAEYFGKSISSKDGLYRTCKACTCAYQRNSYREHSAKKKQTGICGSCLIRSAEAGYLTCSHCRAKNQHYGEALRIQVFAAYGGQCAACGETNPAFLSVDHISNDGAQHRRITGNGHRLYRWLRKNDFPQEGFQLLCANCNWRKYTSGQSGEKTYIKAWYAALRLETFAAYGGKCACCGEPHTDVLTIDHMNNDGAQHRREIGAGSALYSWLRKQGFPQDGFQLLCFNCNRARFYYGVCPHQK